MSGSGKRRGHGRDTRDRRPAARAEAPAARGSVPAPPAAAAAPQIAVRFRAGDQVGAAQAEVDARFLEAAFVDAGYLTPLRATDDPRCVITGRTGAGKTALLARLEQGGARMHRFDPFSVAVRVMEHHTLLPALSAHEVNLDAYYRFLWRQVLVLEILRDWHNLKTATSLGDLHFRLTRTVTVTSKQRRRKRVLDELERWAGNAWGDAEEHTTHLVQKFDQELKASLGHEKVAKLEATFKHSREASSPPAEAVVVSDTAVQRALATLIPVQRVREYFDFLREEVLTDVLKPHYVLIDSLDTAWIESPFAYDLIDALIEVAGEFIEVGNVKVVVALRDDIVAALHGQEKRRNRQWEKHRALFLPIRWTPADLVTLIDQRLAILLRGRYGGAVRLDTLLPPARPGVRGTTTDYVLRRTLLRPRDLIAFVNAMLGAMVQANADRLTWDLLAVAELQYSRERLEALENEWRLTHRGLTDVFEAFRRIPVPFTIASLDDARLTNLLAAGEQAARGPDPDAGSLPGACFGLFDRTSAVAPVWALLVDVLYRIGFLGVKASAGEAVHYRYEAAREIPRPMPADAPLHVHPAFWRALDIDNRSGAT